MKSDIIDRKFIETYSVDDYEILTDTGWKNISTIGKTIPYEVWNIQSESFSLMCADDHIVFDENMNESFVKELNVGERIQTKNGIEKIVKVEKMNFLDNMYDIQLENSSNHRYYTNGILSHNSTIYCIYALWLATFFREKKIMILANKAATALELLGRIETAYEYLPMWLKGECVTFNKSELTFVNMSSIRAFASSSDAARGFSANCVTGDTYIEVRRRWLPFTRKTFTIREFAQSFTFKQLSSKSYYNEVQQDNGKTLSERISKTFQKMAQVSGWQVMTDNGWQNIESILEGNSAVVGRLQLKSGKALVCTPMHIIIDSNGDEVYADHSVGKTIQTEDGEDVVTSYQLLSKLETVYDLSVAKTHRYFTNKILSHNCVILDEFAFLQKNLADKLFTSMYPIISSSKNGKFIIVSTPNGVDNLYYDIWQQANSKEKDKNKEGWKPFTMYWWQVPGHDEEWKAKQIAAIGKQRFAQEFNNEFLASSTTHKLIPDDVIENYRIKLSEYRALDKEFAAGKKQMVRNDAQDKLYEFTMWHEFDPKKTYLASGDCAEGTGSDSSVLYVWDVTDLSNIIQCAKFSSTEVSPVEFAFVTSKVLSLYNNPFYVCERNGIGGGYLDSLKITYNYPMLALEGKNREAGVFSHVTVKERACTWAREMLTTVGFGWTIYDKDLIDEFPTFSRKDNKGVHIVYQAIPPAHDDHIMAWIWACYLLHPDTVENYFVCCKTFTSALDKVYPLLLEPLNEYISKDVQKVIDDPMYKNFMEFKEEVQQKLGKAVLKEKGENKNDDFLKNRYKRDPYFGDFDDESWSSRYQRNNNLNSSSHTPRYYLI